MSLKNFEKGKKHISFEVFPPKKDDEFDKAYEIMYKLAQLQPEFISVTYGAGGSQSKKTIEIASYIQNTLQTPAICHMTCVGATKDSINQVLAEMKEKNLHNILALRGDRPQWMDDEQFNAREFAHASDLMQHIRENRTSDEMVLLGACYPEKHFEASSLDADIENLKLKEAQGCDFFLSQLFFDNDIFYRFIEKARAAGVTKPIVPGIMPLTSAKQLSSSISLSGSSIPKKLADLIAKYADTPDDMKAAGMEYAINQMLDLQKNGADGIHIYSMNRPLMTAEIMEAIR